MLTVGLNVSRINPSFYDDEYPHLACAFHSFVVTNYRNVIGFRTFANSITGLDWATLDYGGLM